MREGKYDDGLWEKYTGKTAPELGEEWKRTSRRNWRAQTFRIKPIETNPASPENFNSTRRMVVECDWK